MGTEKLETHSDDEFYSIKDLAAKIPRQRPHVEEYVKEYRMSKLNEEIENLAESLVWLSHHADLGRGLRLEKAQARRIAEYVAGSGCIRRIVAMDTSVTSGD